MAEFEAYLGMGIFQPVALDTPESKSIPVIPVPMDDEGLPLVLHDGENALSLSSDGTGEPGFASMNLPEEYNDVSEKALKEEDLEEVSDVEELLDCSEDDEDESWTNQIDRVG